MFNFGLLSTHIPYIVFIAAYVFYFLTSPANETMDDDAMQAPEKTIVQEKIPVPGGVVDQRTACYNTCYASQGEMPSVGLVKAYPVRRLFLSAPDDKIPVRHIGFALFSRPPPSIG
jgi:hypothetical protein